MGRRGRLTPRDAGFGEEALKPTRCVDVSGQQAHQSVHHSTQPILAKLLFPEHLGRISPAESFVAVLHPSVELSGDIHTFPVEVGMDVTLGIGEPALQFGGFKTQELD